MKADYFAGLLVVPGAPVASPVRHGECKSFHGGYHPGVPAVPSSYSEEWQQWDEDAREYVEERAAIAEHEGGCNRRDIETESARMRAVVEYQRKEDPGWRIVLGAPDQTYGELVESLHKRFGDVINTRPYRP